MIKSTVVERLPRPIVMVASILSVLKTFNKDSALLFDVFDDLPGSRVQMIWRVCVGMPMYNWLSAS